MILELTYFWIRHYNHDISIGCEDVYEGSKAGVPDFHTLELGLQLTAGENEDYMTYSRTRKRKGILECISNFGNLLAF